MTRDELREMGLEDEQIEKIMAVNGKDIERARSSEKKETRTALEEAERLKKELQDLRESAGQKDTLQAKINDLTKALEDEKTKHGQELEALRLSTALDKALAEAGARNTTAVRSLLNLDDVSLQDGKIDGLSEQLSTLKEAEPYLFKGEAPQQPSVPKLVGMKPGASGTQDLKESISKEEFRELPYTERLKIYTETPELYKQLNS